METKKIKIRHIEGFGQTGEHYLVEVQPSSGMSNIMCLDMPESDFQTLIELLLPRAVDANLVELLTHSNPKIRFFAETYAKIPTQEIDVRVKRPVPIREYTTYRSESEEEISRLIDLGVYSELGLPK